MLLFILAKNHPCQCLVISLYSSMMSSTQNAKNLGITLEKDLSFTAHILTKGHDTEHLQSHTFLNREAIGIRVEALVCSCLDCGDSLVVTDHTAHLIKRLQLIQDAAAQLRLNHPQYTHVSPLLLSPLASIHHRIYMVGYTLFEIIMFFYAFERRLNLFDQKYSKNC